MASLPGGDPKARATAAILVLPALRNPGRTVRAAVGGGSAPRGLRGYPKAWKSPSKRPSGEEELRTAGEQRSEGSRPGWEFGDWVCRDLAGVWRMTWELSAWKPLLGACGGGKRWPSQPASPAPPPTWRVHRPRPLESRSPGSRRRAQ